MSLSSAASWETEGASSVFVDHCPCCSDGVGVGVAVGVAVGVGVGVAVAVLAVAVAASSSCMAAERASTLSAAESMAVCVEGGEGGGVVIWLSGVAGSRRTFLRQFPPPHDI